MQTKKSNFEAFTRKSLLESLASHTIQKKYGEQRGLRQEHQLEDLVLEETKFKNS